MFCLLISQVILYVSEDTNKLPPSTLVDQTIWYAAHWARSSGIKLLEVHGMGKNLDPNIKPEKQHAISKQGSMERPCTGQGRAGLRRKKPDPTNQPINQTSDLSQKIPGRTKVETGKTNQAHTRDLTHSINNANAKRTNNNPRCSLPSRSSL